VPFASRVGKGEYAFIPESTADRQFSFWRLPDGSTSTEPYILINIQEDTAIEVHWIAEAIEENYAWVLVPVTIALIGGTLLLVK